MRTATLPSLLPHFLELQDGFTLSSKYIFNLNTVPVLVSVMCYKLGPNPQRFNRALHGDDSQHCDVELAEPAAPEVYWRCICCIWLIRGEGGEDSRGGVGGRSSSNR